MKNIITKPILYSIIIFAITLSSGIFLTNYLKEYERVHKTSEALLVAENIIQNIYNNIKDGIVAIDTQAMLLKLNNYDTSSFEMLAKELTKKRPYIASLQLAKDGIVSHVFPYEEHKNILGHDLLKDKRRDDGAILAIKNKDITFVGPIKLIQNNKYALIARKPIFKEKSNKEVFWGFSTFLIYIENIVNYNKISNKFLDNYGVILTDSNHDTKENHIFYHTKHNYNGEKFSFNINVPNGKWKLSLYSKEDLNSQFYFLYILSVLISLILSFITYKYEIDSEQKKSSFFQMQKLASLGEMINNIAHQWRQPLCAITMSVAKIQLEKELNTLNDKNLLSALESINKSSQYLSETIDTFQHFSKENKEPKEIVLQEKITEVLKIVDPSLSNKFIKLKNNVNYDIPLSVNLVKGELSQVIINILHNAIDALVEKSIKDPFIEINLQKKENNYVITIEDNAGGIDTDIIDKIFHPYFTTKHKSQGTGLGLYMSHKIITESIKGKLYVENTHKGAKFIIEIPIQ